MTRSPRSSSKLAALLASATIVFAACAGNASPAPSAAPPASSAASAAPASAAASTAAFTGQAYPQTAVDCANRPTGYTGELSQIKAIDANTVEFDLCSVDTEFLQKVAFETNAIMDSDWLAKHAPDKSYVKTTNGTGPYNLKEWVSGDHLTFEANPNYHGSAKALAQTLIVKWGDTAAKRLQDLQAGAGTADVVDNVAPEDYATVQGNSSLQLLKRDPFAVVYLGFNVNDPPWDNEKVRTAIAMGLDRKRINDTFDPAGSTIADYFAPCNVPGGCVGDKFYDYNLDAAKQMLKDANFDFSKTYGLYFRPKVRPYIPNPPGFAQDIQSQFSKLGIKIELHQEDNATYVGNVASGKKYPLFLYGWIGDYAGQTDWIGYHFGVGAAPRFGKGFSDIQDAISKAASTLDETARLDLWKQANNLIKQHVPMVPLTHAASALGLTADTTGVLPSPLAMEAFWVAKPGSRNQIVFEQNAETSGLYCGDESDGDSLRNCLQVYEPLYALKIGGVDPVPDLASKCEASSDGLKWTCALLPGVKFFDGSDFDANDVVVTYAAQWDAKHPLHVGNAGTFEYFPSLWGGLLNPPAS
jgi:ABC-type transport system substrate-binding protein